MCHRTGRAFVVLRRGAIPLLSPSPVLNKCSIIGAHRARIFCCMQAKHCNPDRSQSGNTSSSEELFSSLTVHCAHEQTIAAFLDAGYRRDQIIELLGGVALKTMTSYLDHVSIVVILVTNLTSRVLTLHRPQEGRESESGRIKNEEFDESDDAERGSERPA